MLFRRKAIEKAAAMPSSKLLFINVDPNIIKDDSYQKGFTKNYLQKYSIDPKNIVFEITERTAIDDYEIFSNITNHYKSQEYKLAIDDVGSGYSGLKSITELKPDYVKRNIYEVNSRRCRDLRGGTKKADQIRCSQCTGLSITKAL